MEQSLQQSRQQSSLDVCEGGLVKDGMAECVLRRYTRGSLLLAFLFRDCIEGSESYRALSMDAKSDRDPIAVDMEALRYYVDVLQMLFTTGGAAVRERRDAWRTELVRLRELSDTAADARGEWKCDRCGHRTDRWSYGDAQWLYGWVCDLCYELDPACMPPPPPPPDMDPPSACESDNSDGGGCPRYLETYDSMSRDPTYGSHWLYHQGCMDQREADTGARPGSLQNPWQGPAWMHGVEPAPDLSEVSRQKRPRLTLDEQERVLAERGLGL